MKFGGNGLVIGTRDIAHNHGFYACALFLNNRRKKGQADNIMRPVKEILFKNLLWPIKDPTYFWSNSEGATKWIHENILRFFELDPLKGTNPDQTQPCNLYAALSGDKSLLFKFCLGLFLRLGFYPNFEHIFLKIHHFSPILRFLGLKPLYWLTDIWFYFSVKLDLRKAICESTTNKIRAYLYLVQAEKQPTRWTEKCKELYEDYAVREGVYTLKDYFRAAYLEYFKIESPIYQEMDFNQLK